MLLYEQWFRLVATDGGHSGKCPPQTPSHGSVARRRTIRRPRTFAPLFRTFAHSIAAGFLLGLLSPLSLAAPPSHVEALATVGDSVITVQEYAMALRSEALRRFYHFRPPEREMAAFHRGVAEQLIERTLATQEAKRRGLRADPESVDQQMRIVRARVAKRNEQQHADEQFWVAVRKQIEQEQLVGQLREQERAKIEPTDARLRKYYRENLEKFTEPERLRVSLILLRVSPSSPQSAWEAARREAGQLLERLEKGADFAELARLHSSDASGVQGGDMGYVHKGRLSAAVEEALAGKQPGDVTAPLMVLEGVALFKLTDRQSAKLANYEDVRERAAELWAGAEQERAWHALIADLRSATTVKIEEKYLTPG